MKNIFVAFVLIGLLSSTAFADSDFVLIEESCDEPLYDFHEEGICSNYYQQYYDDVLIEGSRGVEIFINGERVFVKNNYFDNVEVDTEPSLTRKRAARIVMNDIGTEEDPTYVHLVIFPKETGRDYEYNLAWKVNMPFMAGPHSYTYYVDARSGRIITRRDNVFNFGQVTGEIYPEDPYQEKIGVPIANLEVLVNDEMRITDENGGYEAEDGDDIWARTKGPFVEILNLTNWVEGTPIMKNAEWSEYSGNDALWSWADHDMSYKQEETNAFYHLNVMHGFFTKGGAFDIDGLNFPMKTLVEDPYIGQGNAGTACGYNPDGSVGSFLIFGGPFEASDSMALYSDTLYHEYTHAAVCQIYESDFLMPYWSQTGGMNEGFADYFAATVNDDPCFERLYDMAGNFYGCSRNLDNDSHYPEDYPVPFGAGYIEPHDASVVFSASLWDLREAIGKNLADELIVRTMKLEPHSFVEFLEIMLIIDDDNGDPGDGTPHGGVICDSFDAHGITGPSCGEPVIADATPGDINLSGEVNVADVQCMILTSLGLLSGDSIPLCAEISEEKLDLDCNGNIDVNDVLIVVELAKGGGLSEGLDADFNGKVDGCEGA